MILRDRVIKRSTGKTPPYVWLSSNPTNEPTASRVRPLVGAYPPRRCPRAYCARKTGAFRVRWVRRHALGGPAVPSATHAASFGQAQGRPTAGLVCAAVRRSLFRSATRSFDLPLEIQTLEGRWQEIEQDDLKRCYDDLKVKLGDNGRVEEFQTRRRS